MRLVLVFLPGAMSSERKPGRKEEAEEQELGEEAE